MQTMVTDPVNDFVEARWIIRKTVQEEYRAAIGWAVLEIGDGGDGCANRSPLGKMILGCLSFRRLHPSIIGMMYSLRLVHQV